MNSAGDQSLLVGADWTRRVSPTLVVHNPQSVLSHRFRVLCIIFDAPRVKQF